jgi:Zn-dependent protease with chaperone function
MSEQIHNGWDKLKIIITCLAGLYFFLYVITPDRGGLMDSVDLPIHETGHLVFRPFGEFISMAGGTIFQVLFPSVFVAYFFWHRKPYSASLCLLWPGQSFLNVYVYARDAIKMNLPLVGGGIHDWNYMLGKLGLLRQTSLIAGAFRVIGTLVILAAIALSLYYSRKREIEE